MNPLILCSLLLQFLYQLLCILYIIFSILYFFSSSISTSIGSISFYSSTYFSYLITLLTFTIRCIFINSDNSSSTAFSNTISLTLYSFTNHSANYLISYSFIWNTESFILNSILSPTLYFTISFLFLSIYLFILSYDFLNTTFVSLCLSFIQILLSL